MWDREAVTALVASQAVTGEAETNMGSQCCSLRRLHFLKAEAESSSSVLATHSCYRGSCGCTDSAAFAPKICLVLVGADCERHSKSQGDEPLEMLKCSTFTP